MRTSMYIASIILTLLGTGCMTQEARRVETEYVDPTVIQVSSLRDLESANPNYSNFVIRSTDLDILHKVVKDFDPRVIRFDGNVATGPEHYRLLATSHSLRSVNVNCTEFDFKLADAIAGILQLREVEISSLKYEPKVFARLAAAKELSRLTLHGVTATDLNGIEELSSLEELVLSGCFVQASDEITILGKLHIRKIEIGGGSTDVSAIIRSLSGCRELAAIDLHDVIVYDQDLELVLRSHTIREVSLADCTGLRVDFISAENLECLALVKLWSFIRIPIDFPKLARLLSLNNSCTIIVRGSPNASRSQFNMLDTVNTSSRLLFAD